MTTAQPSKIFVTEDEIIISKDIQRSLRNLGYRVVGSAATGQETLQKISEHLPDLVLMDIHLRGDMDGIETARLLKEQYDLPVIYLTAFADSPTLDRAKHTGPFGYLLKPFEERELSTVIEMALYKHNSERLLRESEVRLHRIVETNADGILLLDARGKINFANAAAEKIFGLTREEITARNYDDSRWLVTALDGQPLSSDQLPFHKVAYSRTPIAEHELIVGHAQGRRIILSVNASPLFDSQDKFEGAVFSLTDITERKALEERLIHQAMHDSLTHLPNRAHFIQRLEHTLAHVQANEKRLAVLLLDLDNFKVINDTMGHILGDRLLIEAAARLRRVLREGDSIARLSGDEFTVLLPDVPTDAPVLAFAHQLIEEFRQPFSLEGRDIFVSPSIGIAFSEPEANSAHEVLRHADLAMYEAKYRGKRRFELYDHSFHRVSFQRLNSENDLRSALERGEFYLEYQPRVSLAKSALTGFEALARWNHPTRGNISPETFIPWAEESGLIISLSHWVLRSGCFQLREWQNRYPQHDFGLSLNLSARQFERKSGGAHDSGGLSLELVDFLGALLEETALNPASIILEVTETVAMEESKHTIEAMHALKELGVRLAIDDFGTGYSNMSYLRSFPLDILKIDRRFISGMGEHNKDDVAIVSSLISMAHALGLHVIAEGVENATQIEMLRRLDCDELQGYYVGHPLSTEAAGDYLAQNFASFSSGAPNVCR